MLKNKPKIYSEALKQVLEASSEKNTEERIRNFRNLLKKRGELKIAGRIVREFKKAWSQREGKIAEVITAKPLSAETRQKIETSLKEKGFVMKEKVEPNVLGGIAFFFGDENLVDGTIKNKIKILWNSTVK